eukprot:90911_1
MITPNIIRQYINNISDIATALKCIFPAVWDYSTSINKPTNSPTGRFMSIILNRLENYHFQHFVQIAAQEYADKICESIKFETFFDMKLAIKPLNITLNTIINAPALPDIASIIAPIPIDHPLPNILEIEWNPSRSLMASRSLIGYEPTKKSLLPTHISDISQCIGPKETTTNTCIETTNSGNY